QFGKPVAPAVAKKEGRKATAGGSEARIVRIAFAMASSHRTQRCRLEPTLGRAVANRSRQTCRKAGPQKPPAEHQGLGGGSPCAPSFGGAEEMFDTALIRGGRQERVDISKPFEAIPPVERPMHTQIREKVFFAQGAQSPGPGKWYDPGCVHQRILSHGM